MRKDIIEVGEYHEELKNGKDEVDELWGALSHHYSRWDGRGIFLNIK